MSLVRLVRTSSTRGSDRCDMAMTSGPFGKSDAISHFFIKLPNYGNLAVGGIYFLSDGTTPIPGTD